MNRKRKTENTGPARSKARSTAMNKTGRRGAPALKQIAAGMRWTVGSWLTPAGSDAGWEQSQDCKGKPGANR